MMKFIKYIKYIDLSAKRLKRIAKKIQQTPFFIYKYNHQFKYIALKFFTIVNKTKQKSLKSKYMYYRYFVVAFPP